MANALTIDGKEYTPATLAGKHFGYTKDYLLMLIKQGKIDGKKIGNKWYVHIPSATEHFRLAEEHRIVRRKQISLERKAELKKNTRTQVTHTHKAALIETFVIVIIGLSLGVTGYLGTNTPQIATVQTENTYTFFETMALSLYTLTGGQVVTVAAPNTETVQPVQTPTNTGIVIVPEDTNTQEAVTAIKESFSDPVTVTPDAQDSQTGVITPIFKDVENADTYRYVMVPITTN